MDHDEPFQRTIRACVSVPTRWLPTAQQSDADTHVTAASELFAVVLEFGEGIMDHDVPSHRSISVWYTLPLHTDPTAQQSEADGHATASKELLVRSALTSGAVWIAHEVPSHRSINGWKFVPVCKVPTAQQPDEGAQATLLRMLSWVSPLFGEATIDQAFPSHRWVSVR